MPPSTKTRLLEAAMQIAERNGIAGVTLDAVAEKAGLTKGGLVYHFPTKDALLQGVMRYLIERFEQRLLEQLGQPREAASLAERATAYVEVVGSQGISRADLVFSLESLAHPQFVAYWDKFLERWLPLPQSAESVGLDAFVARLAADGLWLFSATSDASLTPELRKALIARIVGIV